MALVSLQNISVSFGLAPVLDGVTLNIEPGERTAVTGRNGEGKSTLLKIMAGIAAPDAGGVVVSPGARIAYLPQEIGPEDAEEPPSAVSAHMLARYLSLLGVPGGAPFDALSGGQRRRVALARRLASEPDLLLLDEPTNHLDAGAIEWLEDFLARAPLTCLFVTHDRAFLRRTARRILDIDRGRLSGWDCDYAAFLRRKAQMLEDDAAVWERKGKLLAREEEWIRRGVKARTTRNEGRVEALRKLRAEFAGRRAEIGAARMGAGAAEASGRKVAEFKSAAFAYPGAAPLITDFSMTVLRGEKIGVIGANGSGKTTLVKLLTGALNPTAGSVELGARVRTVSVDQMRGRLDPDKTVAENVAADGEFVMADGARRHILGYLQDFLFTPERARTPVRALSGGERARVGLAKLFLDLGNLLVLDEPTNDLDIETLELLEEQLLAYSGTLVIVSHDREFLDNVVTSSIVLPGGGEALFCPGGYSEWKVMSARRAAAAPKSRAQPAVAAGAAPCHAPPAPKRLGYMERRELDSIPVKIKAMEGETAALKELLSDGFIFSREPARAAEAAARLQELETGLDALGARWLELESRA